VQAVQELNLSGASTPTLDAELLLSHVLQMERLELFLKNPKVTVEQGKIFYALIARRKKGEPIAYITGLKEFWGLDFKVTSDVLIPRPESELIIELTKKHFSRADQSLNILDLGTGSGCLAITLLSEYKKAQATIVDISPAALDVAKYNAQKHRVDNRLTAYCGSWFAPLPKESRFDLIVANPPYIGHDEEIIVEVKNYEPHLALYGQENGLQAYKAIAADLAHYMHDDSIAIFEIGYRQAAQISKIFTDQNFHIITIARDLAGKDRTIVVRKI
jgi:release factor glutamine methyltransferase